MDIDLASDRLLTTREVCRAIGWTASTLWRNYTSGTFPRPIFVNEQRRWPASAVNEWLAGQVARPPSARRRGAGLRNVPKAE
jgi:predicted DNA-binding transcriptional regulator AlpA